MFPQPAQDAAELFAEAFHDEVEYASPMGSAWAPGRVNIIGEHTDYNDGFVLPCAVDRVAAFAGRRRSDTTVRLWSAHFKTAAEFSLAGLPETFEQQRAALPGWARYILGVASELARAGIPLSGFDAVVGIDVVCRHLATLNEFRTAVPVGFRHIEGIPSDAAGGWSGRPIYGGGPVDVPIDVMDCRNAAGRLVSHTGPGAKIVLKDSFCHRSRIFCGCALRVVLQIDEGGIARHIG